MEYYVVIFESLGSFYFRGLKQVNALGGSNDRVS